MHKCFKQEIRIQGGNIANVDPSDRQVYNSLSTKHLVSFSDFKSYISDSPSLKKLFSKRKLSEISSALYIRERRFTKYAKPEADKQFLAVFNMGTISKNRLLEMLSYFVGSVWADMIAVHVKHDHSDSDIFAHIKKHIQYSETVLTKMYRMNTICDSIYRGLGNRSPRTLLDIGVGNGKKTLKMRDILGSKVSGADIAQWGPYKSNKQFHFPYKQIQLSPYKIPYPDRSFDCITLILVLHHAEDIIAVINECKRLLTPGGIIALVEHDVWSDETNMLVDLQHRIYKELFNEPGDYYGTYYNFYEWDLIFAKCGMRSISMNYIADDASNFQRYDMQYIAIYQ